MSKKINTEIALILILLAAVTAVSVILMFADISRSIYSKTYQKTGGQAVLESEVAKVKVYEGSYPMQRYGINTTLLLTEGIVANDYGDDLVQFAIKERTDANGELAYDGGFPLVGIRISDSCNGEDATLMCSHFNQLALKPDVKKWQVNKDLDGKPRSVKRISFFAAEEDFYDEYYVKIGDRIVSVYYSQTINPVYTIEGVDIRELPKLPLLQVEEKRMRDFANSLVSQLEQL